MMVDSSYLASTHLPEIGIRVLHYKTYHDRQDYKISLIKGPHGFIHRRNSVH